MKINAVLEDAVKIMVIFFPAFILLFSLDDSEDEETDAEREGLGAVCPRGATVV